MRYEFRRFYATFSDRVIISHGLHNKQISSFVGFDGFGEWEFGINPLTGTFKNMYTKIIMTLDKHTGEALILSRKREVNSLHVNHGGLFIISQKIWEF